MIKAFFLATAFAAMTISGVVQAKSIPEIATGDPQFSTLVAAVTAAGLAETPAGPGWLKHRRGRARSRCSHR